MIGKTSYWNQWLGRAGKARWSNYYELLQLPVGFDDPKHVAAVAERLLARVRSCDPGDRGEDWQKVIRQLKSAKAILTDASKKAVYDQKLLQAGAAKSPPRMDPAGELPASATIPSSQPKSPAPVDAEIDLDEIPMAIPVGAADSRSLDVQAMSFGDHRPAISRVRRRKSHRVQLILSGLCGLLLIGVVVLSAGYLLQQGEQPSIVSATNAAPQTEPRISDSDPGGGRPDPNSRESDPRVVDPEQEPPLDQHPEQTPPQPPPENVPPETVPPETGLDATPPTTPPVGPLAKPLSPVEAKSLARHLRRARLGLTQRQLATARQELATARNLTRGTRYLEVVERLEELAHYVDQFWGAFEDGLNDIKPNQELVIGSTKVIIIDINDDSLTLRAKGMNRTYRLSELPAGVTMRIAELWLKENAASSKMIKGAFLAIYPEDRTAQAKALWLEAQKAGADCTLLLETLDDHYQPADFLQQD